MWGQFSLKTSMKIYTSSYPFEFKSRSFLSFNSAHYFKEFAQEMLFQP